MSIPLQQFAEKTLHQLLIIKMTESERNFTFLAKTRKMDIAVKTLVPMPAHLNMAEGPRDWTRGYAKWITRCLVWTLHSSYCMSLLTHHDKTNIYGIHNDQEIWCCVSWEALSGQRCQSSAFHALFAPTGGRQVRIRYKDFIDLMCPGLRQHPGTQVVEPPRDFT